MNSLKIKFWGTRGSIPVSAPNQHKYGGNTTCYELISDCIPREMLLTIDAGSGLVPCTVPRVPDIFTGKLRQLVVLLTHEHWDHTIGFTIAPTTFIKNIMVRVIGGVEHGKGPKQTLQTLLQPPYFPVDFKKVASHFEFKEIDLIQRTVILVHPEGGLKVFDIDQYENLVNGHQQIPFSKAKFPLEECLEITLLKGNHPEYTICYRILERPTGRVAVVFTDNENMDGIPIDLRNHLRGAHLLVADVQYSRERYEKQTSGFGHGTPDYAIRLGLMLGIKKVGFVHHDPTASDEDIDNRVSEGRACFLSEKEGYSDVVLTEDGIIALADYDEIEV